LSKVCVQTEGGGWSLESVNSPHWERAHSPIHDNCKYSNRKNQYGICSNGWGDVVREIVTLGASVVQGICSNVRDVVEEVAALGVSVVQGMCSNGGGVVVRKC
jgi:hypothetical protein